MAHRFNPTILREYDIRGIVDDTLTEADAYALGRTYAAKAHGEGARTIAVGRDGRTHSGRMEAALIAGSRASPPMVIAGLASRPFSHGWGGWKPAQPARPVASSTSVQRAAQ